MVSADMANIERCWNYPKVLWAEMGKGGIVGWWKDIKQKNARNQVTIFTQNSLGLKWVKGG